MQKYPYSDHEYYFYRHRLHYKNVKGGKGELCDIVRKELDSALPKIQEIIDSANMKQEYKDNLECLVAKYNKIPKWIRSLYGTGR